LDDSGNVGIRYVDRNDIVRFTDVSTIDEDSNGMWVTGLPDNTRIIIEGQDFVSVGMEVEVSEAGAASVNRVAGEPAISE